jgi:hypothetical protein
VKDDILAALDAYKDLWNRLERDIDEERARRFLAAIEAVPGPSQTVRWTRAPIVERLLAEGELLGATGVTFVRDFERTGNAVLFLGRALRSPRVWLMTHLDQISYLVEPGGGPVHELTPLCYHMQREGERPGAALVFDLRARRMVVSARGKICAAGGRVHFRAESGGPIGPGHRVVYDSTFTHDAGTGRITGYLDASVSCAAFLLAIGVLCRYDVELLVALTDEEEGPVCEGNQSFARGGRRLLPHFDAPDLVVVSDVHEARGTGGAAMGKGAVFVERASDGRGAVTPPHLYALTRELAAAVATRGVLLQEGFKTYAPRAEDINAMAVTPNILLFGFLAADRHYATGVPTAHLHDVVHLARATVCAVLLAHTPLWSALAGRDG